MAADGGRGQQLDVAARLGDVVAVESDRCTLVHQSRGQVDVGRVGDAALLEQVGADTRGALVRGAPFLLAAGAQSRFDIQGALREALADLVDLRSSGMCLARWEQQTSLVARRTREGTTARVLLHVLSLSGNRPVVFAKISRGFLDRMNGGLFGGADPTTALEQSAKAAKVSPEQANSRRRCKR